MSHNPVVTRPLLFQMRMSPDEVGRLQWLSQRWELTRSDTLRRLLREAAQAEGFESALEGRLEAAKAISAKFAVSQTLQTQQHMADLVKPSRFVEPLEE